MLNAILYSSVGDFFGGSLSSIYPSFFLGLLAIAVVAFLLIKINSPAPLTLMVCVVMFAALAGMNNGWLGMTGTNALIAVSPIFFPVFVLILLITGAVFAYALWRMFGS